MLVSHFVLLGLASGVNDDLGVVCVRAVRGLRRPVRAYLAFITESSLWYGFPINNVCTQRCVDGSLPQKGLVDNLLLKDVDQI